MKQLLLIIMVLLAISNLYAQDKKEKKSAFNIGGEIALPVGKEGKGYSAGWGGSLQEEFLLGKAGITLNAGYLRHTTRRYVSDAVQNQAWLLAGVRYYFTKNVYTGGQLGVSVITGNDYSGALFAYAAGAGVKFGVLDASLRYLVAGTEYSFSNIGVRLAIVL